MESRDQEVAQQATEGHHSREAANCRFFTKIALDSACCRAGADGRNVGRLDKKGFLTPGETARVQRVEEPSPCVPVHPSLNNPHCMNRVWKAAN